MSAASALRVPLVGLRASSRGRGLLAGVLAAGLPLVGCGGAEEVPADGTWKVTVASIVTDAGTLDTTCVGEGDSARTYQATFDYALFYDGDAVSIDIDGQSFAEGTRAGCNLSYESSVWLEERPTGLVTWRIVGDAAYHGAAGGCENQVDDGKDWSGLETIEVVASEDESIPVGCTYNLSTVGTVVSGG